MGHGVTSREGLQSLVAEQNSALGVQVHHTSNPHLLRTSGRYQYVKFIRNPLSGAPWGIHLM